MDLCFQFVTCLSSGRTAFEVWDTDPLVQRIIESLEQNCFGVFRESGRRCSDLLYLLEEACF